MGRKKIEIKKIGDQRARMVCFSKRRKGLFKKAEEFSRLYNVNIAGVVFSPAGKPFVLGDPRLFLNFSGSAAAIETETESRPSAFVDDISSLSLAQLQEYSLSLKKMRADIMKRLQNKDSTPSSSIRELSMNYDFTQGVGVGVGVAEDNYSTEAAVDYGTHEESMLFGYSDNCNFSPAEKPFVLGDPRLFLNFFASAFAAAVETETESRPSAFVDDISSLSLPQLQEYSLSLPQLHDHGTHEENMLFGYSDNCNQVLGEDMIRSKNNYNCGEDPSVHVAANSMMEGDQGLGFIEGKEATLAATDEDDFNWIKEMLASADDFMEDPFSTV